MMRYLLFILLIAITACETPDIDKGEPEVTDSAISQRKPDGTDVEIEKPAPIIKADSAYDSVH